MSERSKTLPVYLHFLVAGLILGLSTEVMFNLVARSRPGSFAVALVAYPLFVSLAYAVSRGIDRLVANGMIGDLVQYFVFGLAGLAFEWTVLGNGPGSNASQIGMFAMYTAFCFGPRVLVRDTGQGRRVFWTWFACLTALLMAIVLVIRDPQAKIVIAALGMSAANVAWSIWLLILARKSSVAASPN